MAAIDPDDLVAVTDRDNSLDVPAVVIDREFLVVASGLDNFLDAPVAVIDPVSFRISPDGLGDLVTDPDDLVVVARATEIAPDDLVDLPVGVMMDEPAAPAPPPPVMREPSTPPSGDPVASKYDRTSCIYGR